MNTRQLFLLIILFMNVIIYDSSPKVEERIHSNPSYLEIFTIDWSANVIIAYNTESLLQEAYKECPLTELIKVYDTNYLKTIITYINNNEENWVKGKNLDVRCVCLIQYTNGMTDTLSFGQQPYYEYNGRLLQANLGLIELIGMKLPSFMRKGFEIVKLQMIKEGI